MALFLTSPNLTSWRLDIGEDGVLATSVGTPGPDDVVYPEPTRGPVISCTDPTKTWRLVVANSGALTTTAA